MGGGGYRRGALNRSRRCVLTLAQEPPDRDRCTLRVQLAERRLGMQAMQLAAAVADHIADQTTERSPDEKRCEAEKLGDRPGRAERRQRDGPEHGAEDGARCGEAVAERCRAALEARGEALDDLRLVVGLRSRHNVYVGRRRRGLEG